VLFKPKEAFEDLYHHTAPIQGIVLAIAFIVLSSLIGYAITASVLSGIHVPSGASTNVVPGGTTSRTIGSTVSGMAISIVTFFVAAYLVYELLKSAGHARRPDLNKTIGLVGYAKLPAFLMSIAISVVTGLMLATIDWSKLGTGTNVTAYAGSVCGLIAVILVLAIVTLVWGLWVHGHAASVANDVAFGTAAGFTFLAWFIAFMVQLVLSLVVGLGTFL
jgi:hypothetical protein